MDTQMKIDGAKLRAIREAKSWSQEHLASAAGVSIRTVQRVESDGVASAETRLALASALSVSVSDLTLSGPALIHAHTQKVRIPARASLGVCIGAFASVGGLAYSYSAGAISSTEALGSLGVISGLLGVSLGVMGAILGWARARQTGT